MRGEERKFSIIFVINDFPTSQQANGEFQKIVKLIKDSSVIIKWVCLILIETRKERKKCMSSIIMGRES